MSRHSFEWTFEEFPAPGFLGWVGRFFNIGWLGWCCVEAEIEYTYTPGEPMVRYTRNGDGYPGSPPDVEITGVYVTDVDDRCRPSKSHPCWVALDNRIFDAIYDDQKFIDLCFDADRGP